MTKTELEREFARLLRAPNDFLIEAMEGCTASSAEISREAGVAPSVIRAWRNGQTGDLTSSNHSRLLRWRLQQLPGYEFMRGEATV